MVGWSPKRLMVTQYAEAHPAFGVADAAPRVGRTVRFLGRARADFASFHHGQRGAPTTKLTRLSQFLSRSNHDRPGRARVRGRAGEAPWEHPAGWTGGLTESD